MLNLGARGEHVKKIQQALRKEGLYSHKRDTGHYGPVTQRAVKQYQRNRGIKVDGIFGPRTQNMLDGEQHARGLLASPHVQGTPHQEILKAMYGMGNHAINLGKGGVFVTAQDVENFHKNMDDELSRHYKQ